MPTYWPLISLGLTLLLALLAFFGGLWVRRVAQDARDNADEIKSVRKSFSEFKEKVLENYVRDDALTDTRDQIIKQIQSVAAEVKDLRNELKNH